MSVSDRHGDWRFESTRGVGGLGTSMMRSRLDNGGRAARRGHHPAMLKRTGIEPHTAYGQNQQNGRETSFRAAADISPATVSVLQRAGAATGRRKATNWIALPRPRRR
jgi:hypothetical protein